MANDDDARTARAEARRARMTIRRTRLGAGEESGSTETPAERISRVFALTRAAWAMTRRPWPAPGSTRTVVRFVPGCAG